MLNLNQSVLIGTIFAFDRCECHGHGDTCNPLNGENCNCQNNTENDRQCSQKNTKNIMHLTPCWQLQVSDISYLHFPSLKATSKLKNDNLTF